MEVWPVGGHHHAETRANHRLLTFSTPVLNVLPSFLFFVFSPLIYIVGLKFFALSAFCSSQEFFILFFNFDVPLCLFAYKLSMCSSLVLWFQSYVVSWSQPFNWGLPKQMSAV